MKLCQRTLGGKAPPEAQGTRLGVLAAAACPLLKADSLTPPGITIMYPGEREAALASIAGIGPQDAVYEGVICQMSMKAIRMGPSSMGTP